MGANIRKNTHICEITRLGPRRRNYHFSVGLVGCFNFISKTIFSDLIVYTARSHLIVYRFGDDDMFQIIYVYTTSITIAQYQQHTHTVVGLISSLSFSFSLLNSVSLHTYLHM